MQSKETAILDKLLWQKEAQPFKQLAWTLKKPKQGSKKYSTALKLSQFSERPKTEFKYDIGFIGAGIGSIFITPPKPRQGKILKTLTYWLCRIFHNTFY